MIRRALTLARSAAASLRRERGFDLSEEELRRFDEDGFLGPFDLLDEAEAVAVSRRLEEQVSRYPFLQAGGFEKDPKYSGYWWKSWQAVVPEAYKLGARPELVDRVASLLGPDLLLWGAEWLYRNPGQAHRWHEDITHVAWKGVSVWCGLENAVTQSSLKLIPGSQRYGKMPQELALETGFSLTDDEAVLREARTFAPSAKIVQVEMRPGRFFIFAGRMWHGSINTTPRRRSALLFQYSSPQEDIRIPLDYDRIGSWHPVKPPCVLVRGQDRSFKNRLVDPPPERNRSILSRLLP